MYSDGNFWDGWTMKGKIVKGFTKSDIVTVKVDIIKGTI